MDGVLEFGSCFSRRNRQDYPASRAISVIVACRSIHSDLKRHATINVGEPTLRPTIQYLWWISTETDIIFIRSLICPNHSRTRYYRNLCRAYNAQPLEIFLFHPCNPLLCNLSNLLTQDCPSIALCYLSSSFHHSARLISHQFHHFQCPHSSFLTLATLHS